MISIGFFCAANSSDPVPSEGQPVGEFLKRSRNELLDPDRILLLMGPTGIGKTQLAMDLQDALGGPSKAQLISVDSAMIYRGMDIGTAKPTKDELLRYPHDLVDILDPSQPYSVADFVVDADRCVSAALEAGKKPILVGGTMMYLRNFVRGIASLPSSSALESEMLEQELATTRSQVLHDELRRIDPRAAEKIHPNNHQRLVRAVSLVRHAGIPLLEQWQRSAGQDVHQRLNRPLTLMAMVPEHRAWLHERIDKRFDSMIAGGFVDEVKHLLARGDLEETMPSMRAVGYRQAWRYLTHQDDFDTFSAKAKAASRQLAKRQLTWIRQWPEVAIVETSGQTGGLSAFC